MNWGLRIALLYICFAVGILSLAFLSSQQEFHLVTDGYYEKELLHDSLTQAKENARVLARQPIINNDVKNRELAIAFPEATLPIEGNVHFYKPDNAKKDRIYHFSLEEGEQFVLDTKNMSKGKWLVKLSWKNENNTYLTEVPFYFP